MFLNNINLTHFNCFSHLIQWYKQDRTHTAIISGLCRVNSSAWIINEHQKTNYQQTGCEYTLSLPPGKEETQLDYNKISNVEMSTVTPNVLAL